jgi:hypothetical protein
MAQSKLHRSYINACMREETGYGWPAENTEIASANDLGILIDTSTGYIDVVE